MSHYYALRLASMPFVMTLMLITLTPANSLAAIINWDGGGDNLSWTDPLNWD